MAKPTLTADMARALLRYEPETGKLFWLPRGPEWFTDSATAKVWNTRYAGREAFTAVNLAGYRVGAVHDTLYRAHRVAWLLQTGKWPDAEVDHINRDRTDNRWSNLRPALGVENSRNTTSAKGSSSQYLGVSWDARRQKWSAKISVDRKTVNLGRFVTEVDAARAYDSAALQHFGAFASLNFRAAA